jgi:hypothetical protein
MLEGDTGIKQTLKMLEQTWDCLQKQGLSNLQKCKVEMGTYMGHSAVGSGSTHTSITRDASLDILEHPNN